MNKKHGVIRHTKLGVKLLLMAAASLLLAAGAMLALRGGMYAALDVNAERIEARQQAQALEGLRRYVREQGLSLGDMAQLDQWRAENPFSSFILYRGGRLLYDSSLPHGAEVSAQVEQSYFDIEDEYGSTIPFADGTAYVVLFNYEYFNYYYGADWLAAAVGFALFLALIALFIQKKLRYLTELKDELKILEGGDLAYPITILPGDELGELAQGVDDMRKAILERQQGEDRARSANRELIASMSHDLRTPLTSLLGYLELMERGQYETPQELAHFIRSSREKGYRIKALSDKLFEYSLVYSADWRDMPMEETSAEAYFSQLLTEHGFELESLGFPVEYRLEPLGGRVRVAEELMLRVVENAFANIGKYGDKSRPVFIGCRQEGNTVTVTLSNGISSGRSKMEGTRIGLKTCAEIMRHHGGEFDTWEKDGRFTARFHLPVLG